MSRASVRKGKDAERECAELLRGVYPEARRVPHGQSRSGAESADVEGTPFHVEVKRSETVSVYSAIKQAKAATNGRPPIVMHKRNRGEWLVTMTWEDFAALLSVYESRPGVARTLERARANARWCEAREDVERVSDEVES